MNRRALFKNMALAGFATSLPFSSLLARQSASGITNTPRPFHRFQLGSLELTIVTDGHLAMNPVQPAFAPGIAPEKVAQLLEANFRPVKEVDLGINILVIKKDKQLILVDAGAGAVFGPGAGWLPATLADAGIKPDEITGVVLTHAHSDHMSGLLKQDGTLSFPNAQVYMATQEKAFWTADTQDFSKSKFEDKAFLEQMTKAVKAIIRTLENRLHLFDHTSPLFDCIRLELAAGHTPGHTLVHVFSGGEELVHVGDLVHSDILMFVHPEWGFAGDTDFNHGVATRKKVLGELAEKKQRVMGYHLPWPGLGYVRKKEDAFEWIPEVFPYPG